MEPTEGRPAWKRRRRVIVVLALGLASLGAWWSWPRNDSRFVGTWSVVVQDESEGGFVLHRNGLGSVYPDGVTFSWRATDHELWLGRERERSFRSIVHFVIGTLFSWQATHWIENDVKFKVFEISENELLVRRLTDDVELTLRRVQ